MTGQLWVDGMADWRYFLLFGRLEQYEGVEVLVEAMRLVWERRAETRLVVASEGQACTGGPAHLAHSQVHTRAGSRTLFADASLVVLPYTRASQHGVRQHHAACEVTPVDRLPQDALGNLAQRVGAVASGLRPERDRGVGWPQQPPDRYRARPAAR